MDILNLGGFSQFEEIQLPICDSETTYYGGSQYWFPRKIHRLSGCGPVAAANITAYLAQAFPDSYYPLYTYEGIFKKKDFVKHMVEIRKYVIPGMFGLTSVHQFIKNMMEYSQTRGVSLVPHILDDHATGIQQAVSFIFEALVQRIPVAILVLRHPVKEFADYVWHWMTITCLSLDAKDDTYYIVVSTYGERREINFNLLWNQRGSRDIIKLAYVT